MKDLNWVQISAILIGLCAIVAALQALALMWLGKDEGEDHAD